MTAVLTVKERYLEAFEALARRKAGSDPAWLAALRRAAVARFAGVGFPSTRDEDWKYTSVAPIVDGGFRPVGEEQSPAEVPAEAVEHVLGAVPSGPLLVFVNGRYSARLSSARHLPGGGRAGSLAEALRTDPTTVEAHLGRRAGASGDGFVALSTAFVEDGAFVHVPAGGRVDEPIQLVFVTTAPADGAPLLQPRTLVVLGAGSRVTVIETYVALGAGSSLTNAATEIAAGAGAALDHYRVVREGPAVLHVGTTAVTQDRDSTVTTCSLVLGGRLVRHTLGVRLDAPGATCTLNGLYLVDGRRHVDHHVTVDHARPHGTSRQLFKGVMDGHGRAVFNGRILVRRDAQKTDAHQTNKHLLLSEGAEVDSKPQLEIFADDVKCTHGAAEGQLGEDALFYLKTRGIGDAAARALLTYGFAHEVIDRIAVRPLRAQLDRLLLARLQPGRTKETS